MNKKIITLMLAVLMVLALAPVKPTMAGGAYNWSIIYNGQTIATGNAPTKMAATNNAQAYFNSKLDKNYVVTYKYDAGWFYYLYVDKKSEPLWTGSVSVEGGSGFTANLGKKDEVDKQLVDWIVAQKFESRDYYVYGPVNDDKEHTITYEIKKYDYTWYYGITGPDGISDGGSAKGYANALTEAMNKVSEYKGLVLVDSYINDRTHSISLVLDKNKDITWTTNIYVNDSFLASGDSNYDGAKSGNVADAILNNYFNNANVLAKHVKTEVDYKNSSYSYYYKIVYDPVYEMSFYFKNKLTDFVCGGDNFVNTYRFLMLDMMGLSNLLSQIDNMVEKGIYVDNQKIDKYSYIYDNYRLRIDFEKELVNVPNEVKFFVTINVDGKKFDLGSMSAEELNDFVNKYNVPEYYKVYKSGDLFLSSLSSESFDIYEVEFRFELQRYASDTFYLQNHDWRIKQGLNVERRLAESIIDGTNAVIVSEQ